MSKISALIALGALAGVGYYVGKKVFERRKTEQETKPEVFAEERHTSPKEKIQRASLFAVGAIKTGTEKIKEGLDEIVDNDMVSKGESTVSDMKNFAKETKDKTVAFAKDKTAAIKDEIDNLKGMVTSINTGAGEATQEEAPSAELGEAAEAQAENEGEAKLPADLSDVVEETAENIAEAVQEKVESIRSDFAAVKDEVSEAADEIDSLSFDSEDTVSVDTFDFSSADKL